MNKHERFVRLATHVLDTVEDPDQRLECLDCVLACPERCIPCRDSLRYFAHGFINHFLDRSSAALHYPRAAAYIDRWKKRWVTS